MKMVLAVQASIDARWPEIVLALLVIVSVDVDSLGVKRLPDWKWKIGYRNMDWFSSKKIAAGTQVVVLEKAPAANW
ncbi:hypothetical protein [Nitrosomonas sp.]|uniref:hypothetical protein n=2 Tax=Nitrosomonas sp. TaxID=42353 RepID=UPI002736CF91|nr:hypothetical protein [Nitrosomonas sp.]